MSSLDSGAEVGNGTVKSAACPKLPLQVRKRTLTPSCTRRSDYAVLLVPTLLHTKRQLVNPIINNKVKVQEMPFESGFRWRIKIPMSV